MRTYRVIYLSKDNTSRKQRDFQDLSAAMEFWNKQGPQRATLWETEGQSYNVADGGPTYRKIDLTPPTPG